MLEIVKNHSFVAITSCIKYNCTKFFYTKFLQYISLLKNEFNNIVDYYNLLLFIILFCRHSYIF